MNNVGMSIKKLLTNKNTVTIIGVAAAILILYIGYNMRIKSMTDPYPVPYALETLKPGTKITSDQVGTMNVPKAALKGSYIINASQVIGKYVSEDSIIPQGSLFYSRSVIEKGQLQGVKGLEYPDGYVLVNFSVNMETSYANLLYPGEYMDLYLKIRYTGENVSAEDENKLTVGKLINNIKILKVVDSNGNDVFEDLENKKTPAQVIFAVPEEYHILLRKAMYLRTYEATLIPVPVKVTATETPDVTISSTQLKDFINSITAWTGEEADTNIPTINPVLPTE